jgi:AraC-like DNA-binding protein
MTQPGAGSSTLNTVNTVLGEPADTLYATNEPARAVSRLTDIYGPHSLHALEERPLDLRIRSFELAQLHIAQIHYGSKVVASVSETHPHWVFSYLLAGTVRRGRDEIFTPGHVGVNTPDALDNLSLSADAEFVNLRVSEADMRSACRSLLGSEFAPTLSFERHAEPGTAPAQTVIRVLRHLAAAPRFNHPAARRQEFALRDAALYELLLGWPNNAALASAAAAALPLSTRRARDYIHAHAAEAPTVAEIAAAVGVGVRALALGFDKHLGVSPLRYLQQVRLDGARARLHAANPGDTVTRIALDWGFANPGVFAARYRERFGESPSQTLRQSH